MKKQKQGQKEEAAAGPAFHWYANIFPMLPEEELQALADDILSQGLLEPIVVCDGVIIDGRNRLAACERIGMDPEYVDLECSDDPEEREREIIAYISGKNTKRRHMSKGALAMAYAIGFPEKGERGRGKKSPIIGDFAGQEYIRMARTVLEVFNPDSEKVRGVLAGLPLKDAYEDAVKMKCGKSDPVAQLETLKVEAPDLADLVNSSSLKITEAWAAYEKRLEDERMQRRGAQARLREALKTLDALQKRPNDLIAAFKFKEEAEKAIEMGASDAAKLLRDVGCNMFADIIEQAISLWETGSNE